MKIIAISVLLALAFTPLFVAAQVGLTSTVFNRRFIPTIKPGMTYEQVAKLAGAPGRKLEQDRRLSSAAVQYRWKGGRDSALTVTFEKGRMVDAIVLAPNRHTYRIQNNGAVIDSGSTR